MRKASVAFPYVHSLLDTSHVIHVMRLEVNSSFVCMQASTSKGGVWVFSILGDYSQAHSMLSCHCSSPSQNKQQFTGSLLKCCDSLRTKNSSVTLLTAFTLQLASSTFWLDYPFFWWFGFLSSFHRQKYERLDSGTFIRNPLKWRRRAGGERSSVQWLK